MGPQDKEVPEKGAEVEADIPTAIKIPTTTTTIMPQTVSFKGDNKTKSSLIKP